MRKFLRAAFLTAIVAPTVFAQSRSRARDNSDRYDRGREADHWNWSGTVESGRWLYVRNLNGTVRVEPSSGNTVEITATKYEHRYGRASDVKITVEQRSGHGDAVVCAVWNDRTRCDEDGYSSSGNRSWYDWSDRDRNDVSVEFVVKLPRGVKVTATSTNGGVEVNGVESEVVARTTNGDIVARSNGGPVSARTTNGSLTIRTGAMGSGPLDYSTTNGEITVEIPNNVNADVDMRTTNGEISSDFPLTVEGRFSTRHLRGTIGRGGQTLRLSTTNGSIYLRKA
jgi:hypothetical protein